MLENIFGYLEKFLTCASPIIVAWFAYRANRSEKQTKKYLEAQEALKTANNTLKERDDKEVQRQFQEITDLTGTILKKFDDVDAQLKNISILDKKIENLIEISNLNFEFCTSLSVIISSIGSALDKSNNFKDSDLSADLKQHRIREQEIVNKVCKIIY